MSTAVPSRAWTGERGIALLRLALVPIAALGEAATSPEATSAAFPWIVAALGVYAAITLALTYTGFDHPRLPAVLALIDLAFVAVLVYSSGGARSPLKFTFYVFPIGAALRMSPRLTATWAGLSTLTYLAITLPHPDTDLPGDLDLVIDDALSLIWVGGAAVMLSALVQRRERALSELATTRRALARQALDAEAREQRRLAEALHDQALQNVLLARQELTDVVRGVPGAEERARAALDETDRQLRREVFAMHPLGLERAGLGAVLRSLAADAGRRGGFTASVDVAAEAAAAGHQDLVVATARELLTNAARHARASHVDVRVQTRPEGIELTVADDGEGIPPGRLEQAVAAGHIGVAAMVERIRAIDGDVDVRATPGHGTTVVVTIPREGAMLPR